jgi:hypothetical protein
MPLRTKPTPIKKEAPKARKKKHPEHSEQVKFVKWFRENYSDVLIFAVPNGASLSSGPIQWRYLEAEGCVPGIPDLMIPEWKVVIEMKRKTGGVVSQEQSNILDYFHQIQWDAVVCFGADEAIQFIKTFVKRMPGR